MSVITYAKVLIISKSDFVFSDFLRAIPGDNIRGKVIFSDHDVRKPV